jgi:hypothetical protein
MSTATDPSAADFSAAFQCDSAAGPASFSSSRRDKECDGKSHGGEGTQNCVSKPPPLPPLLPPPVLPALPEATEHALSDLSTGVSPQWGYSVPPEEVTQKAGKKRRRTKKPTFFFSGSSSSSSDSDA